MSPAHGVDIYVDSATLEAAVIRRRDWHWWHSNGTVDAHTLGLAVSEALDQNRSQRITWLPRTDEWTFDTETRQPVVVFRQDHATQVMTPNCPWGRAPTISLVESPRFDELGNAVLAQARFSAAASAAPDNKETN